MTKTVLCCIKINILNKTKRDIFYANSIQRKNWGVCVACEKERAMKNQFYVKWKDILYSLFIRWSCKAYEIFCAFYLRSWQSYSDSLSHGVERPFRNAFRRQNLLIRLITVTIWRPCNIVEGNAVKWMLLPCWGFVVKKHVIAKYAMDSPGMSFSTRLWMLQGMNNNN